MERLLEKIIQCKENGLYFVNTPTVRQSPIVRCS